MVEVAAKQPDDRLECLVDSHALLADSSYELADLLYSPAVSRSNRHHLNLVVELQHSDRLASKAKRIIDKRGDEVIPDVVDPNEVVDVVDELLVVGLRLIADSNGEFWLGLLSFLFLLALDLHRELRVFVVGTLVGAAQLASLLHFNGVCFVKRVQCLFLGGKMQSYLRHELLTPV